jgi:colanic acid biosynthesis glycosyl transferase WcaI
VAGVKRPRRILFAAVNYWPEPTGTAPYTTGFAEHLARQGMDVTVVTAMPHYPSWRTFDGYRTALWRREVVNGVRVVRGKVYVPRRHTAVERAALEASFLLASSPLLAAVPAPDVVLGIVPGLSSALLAIAASRLHRVPLTLWFQDLVGAGAVQSGVPGGRRVGAGATRVEGWMERRADRVAIVSEAFRPYLEAAGVAPDRIRRIRNWTHIGEPTAAREEVRRELLVSEADWVCLHAGNMGYKQGLENIVDCARLAEARAPNLVFLFVGDGNQRALLEARGAGLRNIRFIPPQDNERYANILSMADVLLVNQRASVTSMSLPSKLTSYLAAGRPVVAAVSAGEVSSAIADSGGGVVVAPESPAEMLAAILALRDDPARAAAMGARGAAYARVTLSPGETLGALERLIAAPEMMSVVPATA